MNAPKTIISAIAAAAIVSAVGFAYAQAGATGAGGVTANEPAVTPNPGSNATGTTARDNANTGTTLPSRDNNATGTTMPARDATVTPSDAGNMQRSQTSPTPSTSTDSSATGTAGTRSMPAAGSDVSNRDVSSSTTEPLPKADRN